MFAQLTAGAASSARPPELCAQVRILLVETAGGAGRGKFSNSPSDWSNRGTLVTLKLRRQASPQELRHGRLGRGRSVSSGTRWWLDTLAADETSVGALKGQIQASAISTDGAGKGINNCRRACDRVRQLLSTHLPGPGAAAATKVPRPWIVRINPLPRSTFMACRTVV